MLRFRVLGASFSSFGCFVVEIWVLRFRTWVLRFRVLGASFSRFGCLSRFELHWIRYRILVIALDFCSIYIGLVFIKDRPVSSFGCFVFELGCFVFEFWVLRFRTWVLRFRVLGASFSSFGCFVLRSLFSSASFSKLPWFLC